MSIEDWEQCEPVAVTPEIKTAVAWLGALYTRNGAGGLLHVYVDDWNLPVPATLEGWGRYLTALNPNCVEVACWEALRGLTENEQANALAIHRGYYRPEGAHPLTLPMGVWGGEKFWPPEAVRAAHEVPCEVCGQDRLTYDNESLGLWAACAPCIQDALEKTADD